MKWLSLLGAMLLCATTSVSAEAPLGATDITAEQVRQFFAQQPKNEGIDSPMRVVDVGGYRIGVYGVFRPAAAPEGAAIHDTRVAEIFYILEGAGTLVTGGKLREPVMRVQPPNSSMINWRSNAGIEGGVSRRVTRGDMVIIPPGVAHWWSARDGDMTYLIIRPDPGNELALK